MFRLAHLPNLDVTCRVEWLKHSDQVVNVPSMALDLFASNLRKFVKVGTGNSLYNSHSYILMVFVDKYQIVN